MAAARSLLESGGGLLVDLDGTLVDSEPSHRAAFERYFASRGWDVPGSVIDQFMGRRGVETFAAVAGPWSGEDPLTLTLECYAQLRNSATAPEAVPGAREMVAGWTARRVPVCVVTSGVRWWLERAVTLALGLPVPPAITAEDSPIGKPDAAPYLMGAAAVGLAPARCVAVEDSAAGIHSARAAGVGVVLGVTTSLPSAELLQQGAAATIPDLTPLIP